ncbi:MAG: DUF6249 domain-containing protein [Candidatus Zixiibacteriota bacterium]
MQEVLIVTVVFSAIVALVKLGTDAKTRGELIRHGMVDEKAKYLFADYGSRRVLSNLKWGMVLIGIGLALLVRQFGWFYLSDEGTFGLIFLFAGIGFFVYYAVASRHLKENETNGPPIS